jgi:alcohol dehydrogenase (cytochrome c)
VANPGPIAPTGWPAGYPWGTSRPGPDLYTDSVVKLSRNGKLQWYYQLTPHDLYDWDLQNSPLLTTAHGQPVVIDGGKAGILIELNAQTGKLLWKLPVGVHSGHDNDGLITENATPGAHIPLSAKFSLEPGVLGGVESQLATNGSTTFAAVNNLAVPLSVKGLAESSSAFEASIPKATGEMIAVNQDTGKIEWDDKLPSSPTAPLPSPTTSCSPRRTPGTCTHSTRPPARFCSARRCRLGRTRLSPSTVTTSSWGS